jgi:hypothetical protein
MNYNWGPLSAYQDRILTGKFLGPCDKQIMHAKYGNGLFPDGIVYLNQTSGHLQAIMINQHVDFGEITAFSKLFVGAKTPSADEGQTLDVNIFDVVDYYMLKLF